MASLCEDHPDYPEHENFLGPATTTTGDGGAGDSGSHAGTTATKGPSAGTSISHKYVVVEEVPPEPIRMQCVKALIGLSIISIPTSILIFLIVTFWNLEPVTIH